MQSRLAAALLQLLMLLALAGARGAKCRVDPGSHGRLRGESVVVIEIVLVVSSSSRVATLLVSGVRRSVYSSS